MAINTQKLDRWIKRHKYFAIALPFVVVLSIYFVTSNLKAMVSEKVDPIESGYNDTLPNQENELQVEQPNTYYKRSVKDSLQGLREKGTFRNITDAKKEKDSLEKILLELENFSLDVTDSNQGFEKELSTTPSRKIDRQTEAQEQLEYRNMLLKARDERLARSQDYSAPYSPTTNEGINKTIAISASVYRDQFVLPGDRVTLILNKAFSNKGHDFPKNTFVYATVNIKGSRILLDVNNIDHKEIGLTAKDQQDGNIGLYSQRAGELWSEFSSEVQDDITSTASEELANTTKVPVVNEIVRSFGDFFKKKKYRENDKILLMNGHSLHLVTKQ